MKFSKEKFMQVASEQERKQYEKHLHILDGMEVEHGSMIRYTVDGKAVDTLSGEGCVVR